jgi:hypothetical protein
MGEWDYYEGEVDWSHGEHTARVQRILDLDDQKLDKLPELQEALEKMVEGVTDIEVYESHFHVSRGSARSKPRWDLFLEFWGQRKLTKDELAERKAYETEDKQKDEERDRLIVKRIRKERPHLLK